MLALLLSCKAPLPQRLVEEFRGSYPVAAAPNGTVREFELVAAPAVLPLAGNPKLEVWAYDGQVPGPTLRVKLGETLRIRFVNHLPQPTTIHWHGVRVPNAMDGVPYATQPPVEPGQSFTYEFTPKDAGTYWYHPHVRGSEQQERGLYGLLIVDDPAPAPWSQDVAWVLDDWLLGQDGQIFPEFNTRHDLMHDGRWGNVVTVNGQVAPTLAARPGERIRLRLLDSANGRVFVPDWGSLAATIIALDGNYASRPVPAGGFEVAPGNRVDLDVRVPRQPGSYPIYDRFIAQRPNLLGTLVVAGEPVITPDFASPAAGRVLEWREALAAPVDREIHIDTRAGGPYGIQWAFDGQPYMNHADGHVMAPLATLIQGRFHHLRFVNDSYRLHPIHIHGMFFRLLARDGKPVDEPFFRDTVLLHRKESVDLGVVPEDVGLWMMHCHILEHAEVGMMALLRVNPGT